jgi:hypothetical protein
VKLALRLPNAPPAWRCLPGATLIRGESPPRPLLAQRQWRSLTTRAQIAVFGNVETCTHETVHLGIVFFVGRFNKLCNNVNLHILKKDGVITALSACDCDSLWFGCSYELKRTVHRHVTTLWVEVTAEWMFARS